MFSMMMWLATSTADAFCGTYVGGAGSELYNEYSQLAVVRDNNSTTLTIVNDVQGNFDSFALVIPVPEVIPEENVKVIDPAVFERLEAYSQPRLVEYECQDFDPCQYVYCRGDRGLDFGGGCGGMFMANSAMSKDSGDWSDTGSNYYNDSVDVEALYVVGEYEIVILSSEESDALFGWLNDNGYQVPGQSIDLLQEYIDAGAKFLAAKVSEEAGIQEGDLLSPLQFSYESTVFQIPIRIGTLNSKEAQDLVIYSVAPYQAGATKIQNYPEFQIEDECLWDSDGEEFGEYFSTKFAEGYGTQDSASWTTEYAWGYTIYGAKCDPCPEPPPGVEDLVVLGLEEEDVNTGAFFTRIHARYTPAQATQELMLYHSGLTDNEQYRFITHKPELEEFFPVCELGWIENPEQTCEFDLPCCDDSVEGCASAGYVSSTPVILSALGLLFWARRRKRSV